MAELVHSAQNFMNAEDAIIAKKRKKAKRTKLDPHHPKQGPHQKKARTGERKDRDNRKTVSSSGRSQNYTPLNAPLD